MNKYTELSDFEINLLVMQFVLPETQYDVIKQTMDIIQFLVDGSFGYRFFDPCSNPADAMPIIIENGISMVRVNNEWSARQFNNHCIEVNDSNYFRSAMICFLMMKEAENENNNNS